MGSREYQAQMRTELRERFGPYSAKTRAAVIAEKREQDPQYESVERPGDHPDDIVFVSVSYNGDDVWAERIGTLKRLRSLHIDGTVLTDGGLSRVAGLRRLEILNLRQTRITDAGLVHLRELDAITHLWLNENPAITGSGLSQLEALLLGVLASFERKVALSRVVTL